jgi:hypothetical protein
MVATPGVTLLQVPPGVASARLVVARLQIASVPVIAAGCVFTVTVATETHEPIAYDITEVPAVTPVTTPAADTVATAGVVDVHVPPATPSESDVVEPAHTVSVPVIAPGAELTVRVAVEAQVPNV